MKVQIVSILLLSILITACGDQNKTQDISLPAPTEKYENHEEGSLSSARKEWYEKIHSAPEGINWRDIEYENQMRKHLAKQAEDKSRSAECDEISSYANELVDALWVEKGSINQSGSVFDTDYDIEEDMIYVVSAGGTLFKGPRTGNEWEVINQDFVFSHGLLKLLRPESGQKRILSAINETPHYSDDDGLTWIKSDGVDNTAGGDLDDVYVFDREDSTYIFLVNKRGPGQNLQVIYSTDFGSSFKVAYNVATGDNDRFSINKPYQSEDLYIIERKGGNFSHMYQWDFESWSLDTLSSFSNIEFSFKSDLDGIRYNDTITRFYTYNGSNEVSYTEDFGNTWTKTGSFPVNPWAVGLHVSPQYPDIIYFGEVNCWRSLDAGATWTAVNEWWEYYDNVESKLHADIMFFENFEDQEGELFTLISNHGGLSISYDELVTKTNIALEGLNVSQYYSVRTSPDKPELVFAGSQDQGMQRGFSFDEQELMYLDQLISGDYGHIVFTNGGRNMWTTYPFGAISVYINAQSVDDPTTWYTIESNNEAPWLQYMVADPDPEANIIYAAGGSAEGGAGSYMIKLEYQPPNIVAENLPFDFWTAAGGSLLTAIGISTLEDETYYGLTENGRFFSSADKGQTWTQGSTILNNGAWLYGQAMWVSKNTPGTIYVGGSGYGGNAVWKSTDFGQSFEAITEGLPQTLVYDIAANDDESLLFAATENGPYMYVADEAQWYDISGQCAPANTYWSVEFVSPLQTARFGTYGRGIYDFVIKSFVDTEIEPYKADVRIFPNPVDDIINVSGTLTEDNYEVSLLNMQGQRVSHWQNKSKHDLEDGLRLANILPGQYVLHLKSETQNMTLLMIKS